jgi:hypothetical protein
MTEEEGLWLRQQFDRCATWIQEALDRDAAGTHELEDVWAAIAGGRAQLWPNEKSVVVTTLEYLPRKVVLRYWLCGGDKLEDCLLAEPAIEKWAKEAGATLTFISGRPAWLKVLKGYRKAGVCLVKDL